MDLRWANSVLNWKFWKFCHFTLYCRNLIEGYLVLFVCLLTTSEEPQILCWGEKFVTRNKKKKNCETLFPETQINWLNVVTVSQTATRLCWAVPAGADRILTGPTCEVMIAVGCRSADKALVVWLLARLHSLFLGLRFHKLGCCEVGKFISH